MVTGTHTCIRLKGGLIWSTLKVVLLIYEELIERCPVHLVYLGFGRLLRLKCRPPIEVNVLPAPQVIGHVTSEQPAVIQQLVAAAIKQEPITSTNTGTTKMGRTRKTTASVAAGSVEQLPRVEAELKTEPTHRTSQVIHRPFSVSITRLMQAEIDMYTKKVKRVPSPKLTIVVRKLPLQANQSVTLCMPQPTHPRMPISPAVTHAKTRASAPQLPKKPLRKISGRPSELVQPRMHTFTVKQHILRKHKRKAYLKCRISGCSMAYVTFNTVRAINTHHRIYHRFVTFNCETCNKTLPTPNALQLHKYSHSMK